MKTILRSLFAYTLCLMAMVTMSYAQSSQQMIGAFPQMDGGFEGQNAGTVRWYTGFSGGVVTTDWTQNAAPGTGTSVTGTLYATTGRSGPKYASIYSTVVTSGRPLQSPTAASGAIKAI